MHNYALDNCCKSQHSTVHEAFSYSIMYHYSL